MNIRNHFGYLVIDHRASPGVPDTPGLGPGSVFEADTVVCNHCSVPVVLNPLRQRARFICPKCDAYCCDICAVGFKANGVCRPFEQALDEARSQGSPVLILAKDAKD